MDKLKGMTEYVLESQGDFNNYEPELRLKAIDNYAKFLSQPLTLGMFVPCSLEGEVLEEPEETDLEDSFFSMQKGFNEDKAYQSAKERVLFEGFEIFEHPKELHYKSTHFIAHPEYKHLFAAANKMTKTGWRKSEGTIEKFVKYNLPLTESAKKKINSKSIT